MAIDPELERRLAAGLRAELDREVGPRPAWAEAPDELRPSPRRRTVASALIAAVVVVALATVGGVLLVGGTPSPSASQGAPTGQASVPVSAAPPTVPAGPFDILFDGRRMSGAGWRLLAATYRVPDQSTQDPGSVGSIWAVNDPAILPKVWLAIGRDDLPAIDWTREVVVAVDTPVGFGSDCGQVLVDDVTFDSEAQLIAIRYEDASALVVFPPLNGSLPTGGSVRCSFGARSALLIFALERAHVPTGPITIAAFRDSDPRTPVAETRALLVTPPNPSGVVAAPILDAGFATADFGWVRTETRLLVTDDAGATWRDATPPTAMYMGVVAGVSFRDASNGWLIYASQIQVIGPTGTLLRLWRTADGGRTWASSQMPSSSQGYGTLGDARIVWIDAEHVVVDIEGGMPNGYADDIFATADGGRTWPIATSAGSGVTGVPAFADATHGFLVGGAGGNRLYATHDRGRTWQQIKLDLPSGGAIPAGTPTLADARFSSSTVGLLVAVFDTPPGQIPVVYRTDDGGRTWKSVAASSKPPSTCLLISGDAWTCMSPFWISTWTDGGLTVSDGTMTGLPPNADVHFVDPSHGWARADQDDPGALYLTSDGGATWQRIVPGP